MKSDGLLDFLGLGPQKAGTSGADAEIGPGVYVTDDKQMYVHLPFPRAIHVLTNPRSAIAFANNNAVVNKKDNPNITPQLCAIFAKSSGNWRQVIRKAFFADNLVKDSSDPVKSAQFEQARLQHLQQVMPGVSAANVVKFATLDRTGAHHSKLSSIRRTATNPAPTAL